MTPLPFDHTAVAVTSLEDAIALYESVTGSQATPIETLVSQGVRVAFVGNLELIEPLGPDTPVGRFLDKHGPCLHHIAYRTTDIERELGRLAAAGFAAVDQAPRPGARGHRVAFLQPRGTGKVLIELVQAAE